MIQQLSAKNFRVFKEKTAFKLAPITVLTGTNNSGKSSINTLIELIKDIFSNCSTIEDLLSQDFNKNTDFIKKYGGLKNLFTRGSVDEGLTFSIALYIKELYDYVNIELTIDSNLRITDFTITTQEEDEQLLKIYIDDNNEYLCKVNFSFIKKRLVKINLFKLDLYYTLEDAEKQIKEIYGKDFEVIRSQIKTDLLTHSEEVAIKNAEKELIKAFEKEISVLDRSKLEKYQIEVFYEPVIDISYNDVTIYTTTEFLLIGDSFSTPSKSLIDFVKSIQKQIDFFDFTFLFQSDNEEFKKELISIFEKEFGKGLTIKEYNSKINDLIINKFSETFSMYTIFTSITSNYDVRLNNIINAGLKTLFLKTSLISLSPRKNYFESEDFIEKLKLLCILKWTNNENYLFEDTSAHVNQYESEKGAIELLTFAEHILLGNNNDFAILDSPNTDLFNFIKKDILEKHLFNLQWVQNELNLIEKITTIKTVSKRNHSISDIDGISKIIATFNQLNDSNKIETINVINSIIQDFKIGKSIEITCDQEKDSYNVYLIKNDEQKYLIDDNGHGIMQLIPLLLRIILNKDDKKILLLEEPEVGLHPAYQSKLAEIIAKYAKWYNMQFIIETHSEYFIRKLQLLVAITCSVIKKNDEPNLPVVLPEDVQIYYFYPPDQIEEGKVQVYPINIHADGCLSEYFGEGFYDHSSLLNIQLFQYSSVSKN